MTRYLRVDELVTDGRYYDVPVTWIGEEGDAVALTSDWRRGAAAIHALGRDTLLTPVSAEEVDVVWARFAPHDDYEWVVECCAPGDNGAVRIVWATDVSERLGRQGIAELLAAIDDAEESADVL